MKKILLLCLLIIPLALKAQDTSGNHNADSLIAKLTPRGYVTDYAGTLKEAEKDTLSLKLKSFSSPQTAQIAVAIISTIGDNNIMTFGTKLGRKWGVGYKGVNNGILVLVAINDRKMAILTGRGYEKVVSNAACDQIIKTDMVPRFRQRQYYEGLNAAVDDLIKCVKGEYKVGQ